MAYARVVVFFAAVGAGPGAASVGGQDMNADGSPTRHELAADAMFEQLKSRYRMQAALKLARNFIQNCPESEQADTVLGVIEEALG